MAFVKKEKKGWSVRNGSNGAVVRRTKKRSSALAYERKLTKKYKPKKRNRGKNAKKRFF